MVAERNLMKDHDVIAFDYELWVEGQDALYDTTMREAAEKAGVLEPHAHYGPMHYVLGAGRLISGLEKALLAAPLGRPVDVTIPPTEAYGDRTSKMIETIPVHEFKKNKVDPEPGAVIRYQNRRGLILTVGGGRVRVDFNPPLAGKTLRYRFTVRTVASSLADQVLGVLQMDYPNSLEWTAHEEGEKNSATVSLRVPEPVSLDANWLPAKYRIVSDLRRFVPLARVRFVEEFRVAAADSAPLSPRERAVTETPQTAGE